MTPAAVSSPDLEAELKNAEEQAWNALAHGKYAMFGYWAAWVVKLRKLTGHSHDPTPFGELRAIATSHWKVNGYTSDEPMQAEP